MLLVPSKSIWYWLIGVTLKKPVKQVCWKANDKPRQSCCPWWHAGDPPAFPVQFVVCRSHSFPETAGTQSAASRCSDLESSPLATISTYIFSVFDQLAHFFRDSYRPRLVQVQCQSIWRSWLHRKGTLTCKTLHLQSRKVLHCEIHETFGRSGPTCSDLQKNRPKAVAVSKSVVQNRRRWHQL